MSAGWAAPVEGLAEKVRALIEAGKLPPAINVAAIEGAAARYHAFAPTDARLSPSETQEKIEGLIAKSDDFAILLNRLPIEVSDALDTAMARGGGPARDVAREARDVLQRLAGALELARREVADAPRREGRPPAKHALLVLDLADIVQRAGGAVDHSAKGAVGLLAKAILDPKDNAKLRMDNLLKPVLRLRQ
jgi:hypothetical protein